MKKTLVAMVALSAFSVAFAEEAKEHNWYDITGWSGSYEYSYKEKQNSTTSQVNNVMTMTSAAKFKDGWSVEAVNETERKSFQNGLTADKDEMEGITQIGLGKSFKIEDSMFSSFTPYVKISYGHKFKSTMDFDIYRYDLGTNFKMDDSTILQFNWRHRQATTDTITTSSSTSAATDYKTNEATVGLTYKFTPKDGLRLAKKIERADAIGNASTEYNTTSLTYSRSF